MSEKTRQSLQLKLKSISEKMDKNKDKVVGQGNQIVELEQRSYKIQEQLDQHVANVTDELDALNEQLDALDEQREQLLSLIEKQKKEYDSVIKKMNNLNNN